jgi:hypothetical protein
MIVLLNLGFRTNLDSSNESDNPNTRVLRQKDFVCPP